MYTFLESLYVPLYNGSQMKSRNLLRRSTDPLIFCRGAILNKKGSQTISEVVVYYESATNSWRCAYGYYKSGERARVQN